MLEETIPMRDHYTQQLEALHAELRSLGQLVVAAITWSLGAFTHHDTAVAERLIADDQHIDQAQNESSSWSAVHRSS